MAEQEVEDDSGGIADSELIQLKRQLRIMEKDYHSYKEHTKNLIRKQTYANQKITIVNVRHTQCKRTRP